MAKKYSFGGVVLALLIGAVAIVAVNRFIGLPEWANNPNSTTAEEQTTNENTLTKLLNIDMETMLEEGNRSVNSGWELYIYSIPETDFIIEFKSYLGTSEPFYPSIDETHFFQPGPANSGITIRNCRAVFFKIAGLDTSTPKKMKTTNIGPRLDVLVSTVHSYVTFESLRDNNFSSVESIEIYGLASQQPIIEE